jgi:uncharacterized membrane protein
MAAGRRDTAASKRSRSTASMLVWNHTKLWLALGLGVLIFLLSPGAWSGLTRVLVAWNGAAIFMLVFTYFRTRRLDGKQLRAKYEEDDPTGPVLLLVVVTAALLSVMAIVALLSTVKPLGLLERGAHAALATLTILDSWALVPMLFTLHYADIYYSAAPDKPPLLFPQTAEPRFSDFVYFSFTIAVACQTADVATGQVGIRPSVIAHSIISFFFNVSILGFAINVSAGLLGGG